MASKKRDKRRTTRKARRVLNQTTEGPTRMSSRRLIMNKWGTGVSRRSFEKAA